MNKKITAALPLISALCFVSALPARAQSVDIPLGPAYDGIEYQVAALNKEKYDPKIKEWKARGLHFTQTESNTGGQGEGLVMIMIVRRKSDEARASALAHQILGPAADRNFSNAHNIATIEEYLAIIADSVKEIQKASGQPIAVDYGAVRDRVERDLKGAVGAVYIVTSLNGR